MIHTELTSGAEVLLVPSERIDLVEIQVWVGVGSYFELPSERGLSHFLEHMVFKGTPSRPVGVISQTIESLGGEFNAYTSYENTVYHLSVSSKNVIEAISVLSDALTNSTFLQAEFELERDVILEEIKKYDDSPAHIVGKRVFEHIYQGLESSRSIIGSIDDIKSYTRENLIQFYRKWYFPKNFKIIISGNFLCEMILTHLESCFSGVSPEVNNQKIQTAKKLDSSIVVISKGDYKQPMFEIGFQTPAYDPYVSPLLDLVAFILGGGDGSRFNQKLRVETGLFNAISSSHFSPIFGGLFSINGLLPENRILKGIEEVAHQINKVQSFEAVTHDEIHRARSLIKIDRLCREETIANIASMWGQAISSTCGLAYQNVYDQVVELATPLSVHQALKRHIDFSKPVISILVPRSSSLGETQVQDAYSRGLTRSIAKAPKQKIPKIAPKLQDKAPTNSSGIREPLRPGITFVMKQRPQESLFSLVVATRGGLMFDGSNSPGISNAIASMISHGPKELDYREFIASVENRGAQIEGFSGKDSFGIKLECLLEDIGVLVPLAFRTLLEPKFPASHWNIEKDDILESLNAQEDSPSTMVVREFHKIAYGKHPYSIPIVGTKEFIESLNTNELVQAHRNIIRSGDWVVSVVSHGEPHMIRDLIKTSIKQWCPDPTIKVPQSSSLKFGSGTFVFTKDREQSHVMVGYPGLCWKDPQRPALDVLAAVLGGSGGRMFLKLRDELGLAYAVSPILSYGCDLGIVGGYIACSPSKMPRATKEMNRIFEELQSSPPSDKELNGAIELIIGEHLEAMQRAEAQSTNMVLMEIYGCGFDDQERYAETIRNVTKFEVSSIAQKIFNADKLTVVVGPNSG